MERDELILNLPNEISLSYLEVVPEFSKYNELLQRVVVFTLLHAHEDSVLSDIPLYELASRTTTGAVDALNRSLSSLSNTAQKQLNMDVSEDDVDNRIAQLDMSLTAVGRNFKLTINIQTESLQLITGALTING